jgi:hypothetical protein
MLYLLIIKKNKILQLTSTHIANSSFTSKGSKNSTMNHDDNKSWLNRVCFDLTTL